MNTAILLQIIELALAVIKSRTSSNTDDKIDEGLAIARIYQHGKEAMDLQTGQSVDESLIVPKKELP